MNMTQRMMVAAAVVLLLGGTYAVRAEEVDVRPGNIGSDSVTAPQAMYGSDAAWLNPSGYDFATNRYAVNLATYNSGDPVALQGFVDISQTTLPETGGWTKYWMEWSVRDNENRVIKLTLGTDWLGGWHGIDAQPWDMLKIYQTMGYPKPESAYCTVGGTHDMSGGGTIYPTDRKYYVQLVMDATARTFTLQAYGNGNGGGISPPNSLNSTPEDEWYDIGTITIDSGDFNFEAVEFYASIMASDTWYSGDTGTFSWTAANLGSPLEFSQTPVPEPATMSLLGLGLAALVARRRRK